MHSADSQVCPQFSFDVDAHVTACFSVPLPARGWALPFPNAICFSREGKVLRIFKVEICMDCCMDAGISVPHDAAVLCGSYDDLLSHAVFPTLSGVLNPTEQIGYTAAQILHQQLQGKKVPNKTTYLPPLGIKERLSTDTLAVEDPKLIKVVNFLREHAFESNT